MLRFEKNLDSLFRGNIVFYFEGTVSQFPLQKHHEHTSKHNLPTCGYLYVKGLLSQCGRKERIHLSGYWHKGLGCKIRNTYFSDEARLNAREITRGQVT